jgi:hypothetical protein
VGGLELARLVTGLAAEYNGAWLVVERNNHGSGVLALAETNCGYMSGFTGRGAGGVADHVGEPAGGAGPAGRGAGGAPERFRAGSCWANAGVLCGCRTAGRERGRERTTTG